MQKDHQDSYQVVPFPVMRRFSVDGGYLGRKRHTVHGLLELDVTLARQAMREHKAKTGEGLSFTAFILTCLSKAVESNREVQAYLDWRGRLIIFEDVNVNTIVEIEADGIKIGLPYIVHAANRKTFRQIHDEIRQAQQKPASTRERRFMGWFLHLPGFIRRAFYSLINGFPQYLRPFVAPVLVTAVGMFGKGSGWGIPVANFPLVVTLGGIAEKPGVVEGRIEIREYLCVTLSFDHNIIDGAPAARFTSQFRELVESASGLEGSWGG